MARSRRRRRARRGLARVTRTALLVGALLVGAVVVVVTVLGRSDGSRSVTESCGVQVDGTRWLLSPVQGDNAALLAAVSVRRGLPARAATIAIATALQESKLVNLGYGDRDSVGLFQQRPSQGWGTAEQIMDPVYSTDRFYDGLVAIAGYQDLPITDAAQKVQRSAFPEAYAQHEARARAWASALTGWSPGALTCTLHAPSGAGSSDVFTARVDRDLGALPVTIAAATDKAPAAIVVDARSLGGGSGAVADDVRGSWAFAQWAVAVAADQHVTSVRVADQVWSRKDAGWAPTSAAPVASGSVEVTLAAAA
ncbi:MAG TPA: hypothetical protein VFW79_04785 [Cellulomonas sp.]|uniref:hypothetical protein n=1 Tax=Cellulomonas sp. TaxID=40001 RepID=UPI002E2F04CA|nr:hypothetical protein [Cellulomonas sp.]HEX5331940.1 hypothetical protein [Cellulomonas sp.]